jgi:DNA-binding CsgD family transcriptional regulator
MPETEVSHGSPNWVPWTADDDRRMFELHEQGLSCRQISEAMGRTFTSVRARWHRKTSKHVKEPIARPVNEDDRGYRFRAPRWSKEDGERFLALHAEGKTYAQIAKALDRSIDSVRHRVKRLHAGQPIHGQTMAEAWAHKPRKGQTAERPSRAKVTVEAPQTIIFPLEAIPQQRVKFRDFHFSSPNMRLQADRREFAAYLSILQEKDPWPPEHLLDLIGGLMTGQGRDAVLHRVALAMGCTPRHVLDRWQAMTTPVKAERGIVSLEGIGVLVSILRESAL